MSKVTWLFLEQCTVLFCYMKINVAYFWVAFWLGIDILHGGFLTWVVYISYALGCWLSDHMIYPEMPPSLDEFKNMVKNVNKIFSTFQILLIFSPWIIGIINANNHPISKCFLWFFCYTSRKLAFFLDYSLKWQLHSIPNFFLLAFK